MDLVAVNHFDSTGLQVFLRTERGEGGRRERERGKGGGERGEGRGVKEGERRERRERRQNKNSLFCRD